MIKISKTVVAVAALALIVILSSGSASATFSYYVVANNNTFPTNTVSVYQLSGTSLVPLTTVPTGGAGSGGGYFAEVTQSVALDGTRTCVFAGDANSGDISAMKASRTSPYLTVVKNYFSPDGDTASNFGLGIAVSGQYLYANYTGGSTAPAIGVWKLGAGCTLTYVMHLVTNGLNGGTVDSMSVTPPGNVLVAAYGDGSVGSYAVGNGSISLIGQEMTAGYSVGSFAGSVITPSHNWAIFGDFSPSNNTQLDVALINSDGSLAPTTTYGGTGSLGTGVDSNGIQISPDFRFIYIVDSYSGQETTVSFDATTGVISYPNGCLTNLKGNNSKWVFASQVATVTSAGSGGGLYISEGFLTGDSYIALLRINNTTGCATEVPNSPFVDTNGGSLESISSWSRN